MIGNIHTLKSGLSCGRAVGWGLDKPWSLDRVTLNSGARVGSGSKGVRLDSVLGSALDAVATAPMSNKLTKVIEGCGFSSKTPVRI